MELTTTNIVHLCWSQCWQLTALIALVGLLGATVLRQRPYLLHLLWILVFVKSLTLPLWSSPTSVFSWLQSRPPVSQHVDYGYLAPAPSPTSASLESEPSDVVPASHPELDQPVVPALNIWIFLGGIWALGVVVLFGLAMRRWVEVYRLLKQSRAAHPELERAARQLTKQLQMTSRVRVLVSEANLGPMVFGSYRPVLILPDALIAEKSPRELRPILAHELLHARRGDTTFGALQFIAQVLWWFHPLVWWAVRQANRTSERCCDEAAIANLNCKPGEYARCLLDALELRARLSAAPALPGIRPVDITTHRVENIMKNNNRFQSATPRYYWILAVILALIVLPGGGLLVNAWQGASAAAPADPTQSLKQEAEQAAASMDWKLAAEKFQAVIDENESDGRAWFMLGYCLHADGKLDEAIVAHKRAATFPGAKRVALYNLACAYALKGKREAVIQALQGAVDAGFIAREPIVEDSDFDALRDDPEFLKLAEAAKPPGQREVYRQFDFWVGTWDVFGRSGQQVGTNVITKNEKGFLLTEKWTNTGGSTGTSINYYDPSEKMWKQTWVDAGGNVVQYGGGFKDGKMSLEGRLTKPNGEVIWSRVSYSLNKDGSVRQLIEHSKDEGQTWNTYFDGKYVRRAKAASAGSEV